LSSPFRLPFKESCLATFLVSYETLEVSSFSAFSYLWGFCCLASLVFFSFLGTLLEVAAGVDSIFSVDSVFVSVSYFDYFSALFFRLAFLFFLSIFPLLDFSYPSTVL